MYKGKNIFLLLIGIIYRRKFMIGYIIISLISFLIIIGIYKWLSGRALDKIQQYKEIEFEKEKEKYLNNLNQQFNVQKENYSKELVAIKNEIEQTKQFNSTLLSMKEREIDNIIEEKRKAKEAELDRDIKDWAKSAQEAANEYHRGLRAQMQLIDDAMDEEIQKKIIELEEYKEKRDAINQDILRARAVEEQQDFYRVQLDEISKKDISIINSIRSQLSKIDFIDKLVYDIYVKKSVDEMIKRVLNGRAPCGIYKITRLKTGEIYIGKSTDIKSRWQQHAKSAFHCGTISHSILHTTMEKDGIDQFTWELLEEVPKEKLGEREKYWIEFYDSKKYGLNERLG